MSFDVFAQSFRNGSAAPADATAARAVMAAVSHKHDPQFKSYDVEFADGSHLEMFAGGLGGGEKPFDGAMFALRGVSGSVGDFIFEFTRAANCVLSAPMETPCVLLTSQHLPDIKIRVVNVVDLLKLESASEHSHGLTEADYDCLFTTNKHIIFAFHGYPWLIHRLASNFGYPLHPLNTKSTCISSSYRSGKPQKPSINSPSDKMSIAALKPLPAKQNTFNGILFSLKRMLAT